MPLLLQHAPEYSRLCRRHRLFQMQPELPAWEAWLAGGLLLLAGQRVRRNAATRGLAIVACLAIGFAFAAWRARSGWAITWQPSRRGGMSRLSAWWPVCRRNFAGGSRFEFDVEGAGSRAVVPGRIMLSWYQGRRDSERTWSAWSCGRALAPHGSPETATAMPIPASST